MTTTVYPNGQTLASSAFTVPQMSALWQTLTCGMLGVNPPDYSRVTVDWQQEGQPFMRLPTQDRCALLCVPTDVEYSRVRDESNSGGGTLEDPVTQTWVYTKGWRIAWAAYGPNAEDNMRAVRSGMFMSWVNDQLAASSLYLVNDPKEITYMPEVWNAQWWPRADFEIELYEQITEVLTTPVGGAVTSVEINLNDGSPDDPVADFTVTK